MPTATQNFSFPNFAAGNQGPFTLKGGKYAVVYTGSGIGTQGLQMLGPDGATWIPVYAALTITSSYNTLDLPPGTYRFVVAGFTASYASITQIPT